jgi:hypothetical protein
MGRRGGDERMRVLVVGDADVGKSTFVQALCSAGNRTDDPRPGVGCQVSVRLVADGLVEEFYDVCGRDRFEHGRPLFYRSLSYDALILVHDVSDPTTRSSLSRVWVPETMAVLGDVKAVEAGGRHESAGQHVRSRGVLNELRVLWLHLRSKHVGGVTPTVAVREALRLSWRLGWLLLNEYGVWTDGAIDRAAEREMLASSSVPVAMVGLKKDQAAGDEWTGAAGGEAAKNAACISLVAFNAADDAAVAAFLGRAAKHARRRGTPTKSEHGADAPHVTLPFT